MDAVFCVEIFSRLSVVCRKLPGGRFVNKTRDEGLLTDPKLDAQELLS